MSDSFIVGFWQKIFHYLRYVSVFQYVRMIPGIKGSHAFVEKWVLGNLVVSLLTMVLLQLEVVPHWLAWIILVYSFTRVLEIFVYQVNVLLFDPYLSSNYQVKSYRRSVVLLIHNYIEVVLWYATSYMVLSKNLDIVISKGSMADTLFFSFVTMVTFGSNSLTSFQHFAQAIIFTQAVIGLFMTIVSLARFIGLLPKPGTTDQLEKDVNEQLESLQSEVLALKATIQNQKRK
jgi:hypothetical protein